MERPEFCPSEPDAGMYGSDRDTFLRVWQRVMPEERADCPVAVERSKPAQRCGTEPAGNPARSPDRAESDFPPPEDVPCLGCGGKAERERLQESIGQALSAWRAYQMLARRAGQGGRLLSALAGDCRRDAKRLSTALFLISGIRFWPEALPSVPAPRSCFGALREHFIAEQNRAERFRSAAVECEDLCLRALYLDLADGCVERACRIRSLLETM